MIKIKDSSGKTIAVVKDDETEPEFLQKNKEEVDEVDEKKDKKVFIKEENISEVE